MQFKFSLLNLTRVDGVCFGIPFSDMRFSYGMLSSSVHPFMARVLLDRTLAKHFCQWEFTASENNIVSCAKRGISLREQPTIPNSDHLHPLSCITICPSSRSRVCGTRAAPR